MKIKLFKIVAFFTIYYVVCPQINVAHANSSTNLKPLLRTKYYPPSGRAIQYNKTILPKRMVAGSKITWQISGTGQLRSIAAGSSYGTTFQQTLGTDRTPRAVLKSTGSGRITIKLYEASGAQVGKLILKRPYTFFTINLLQESGQTANYLPSGKSIRKWHLKSRGSHTLYLATEPSTNKVKLNLVTDLIWRTGFPKYKWAVYSPNGSVTYIDGGDIAGNGVATITFSPDNSPYFFLMVGTDANGDGTVSKDEMTATSPILHMIVISSNDYDFAQAEMAVLVSEGKTWTPFAAFLLSVFERGIRDGDNYPGGDDAMQDEMDIYQSDIDFLDSRLTHVAGATFNAASGNAGIYRFVFKPDSYGANLIYNSTAFKEFLTRKARDAEEIVKNYPDDPNTVLKYGPHPTNNPAPIKKYEQEAVINFDAKWEPIRFRLRANQTDLDLFGAINRAMICGDVTVYMRKVNGIVTTEKIDFTGTVEDPYDFDYEADPPAPTAATLQLGWRPQQDTDGRYEGKIYITQVNLNRTIMGPF